MKIINNHVLLNNYKRLILELSLFVILLVILSNLIHDLLHYLQHLNLKKIGQFVAIYI